MENGFWNRAWYIVLLPVLILIVENQMPEIVLTHPFVQFCGVQLNDAACWYAAKIYTRWLLYSLLPVTAGCEAWLVNAVVDSFTESHSVRCLEILAGMNEPHDKVRYACVILLCPMTNYELLRWLVETLSRDIRHYRILNVSAVNGSTFLNVEPLTSSTVKNVEPSRDCNIEPWGDHTLMHCELA